MPYIVYENSKCIKYFNVKVLEKIWENRFMTLRARGLFKNYNLHIRIHKRNTDAFIYIETTKFLLQ